MRLLRWQMPQRGPRRPYRDTALLYGVFAVVIVLVAVITGGNLVSAIVIAVLFWLVATGYSWLQWRRKSRQDER